MITLRRAILAILLLAFSPVCSPVSGRAAGSATQSLFTGDRQCGDNPFDCAVSAFVPQYRYLHVIVHDAPGNTAWAVWTGSQCQDASAQLAGAAPIGANGFREVVADMFGSIPTVTPRCLLFRGGYGKPVTYYAAYTDDVPVPDGTAVYPNYASLGGRIDEADLDITYIHRTPVFPYDANPNLPSSRTSVAYTAHVKNQGGLPVPAFAYAWLLDGKQISSGQSASVLNPFAEQTFLLSVPWSSASHHLTFRAYTSEPQLSTRNDTLTIDTAAITLGFWVERSGYTYFRDHQLRYCLEQGCNGSDSFEDWLQRQVQAWNDLLRRAAYPGIDPGGIQTRVRVDGITVVPDAALPLHGGIASDTPDKTDHSVDLQWGLPSVGVRAAYPLTSVGPFRIDWPLLHELGHARSLADYYRFNVRVAGGNLVNVSDSAGHASYDSSDPFSLTSKLRAFTGTDGSPYVYQNQERDLMACVCSDYYGPYSALVLNRLRNNRALCGNFNAPCNIGDWFLDLPPRSLLRVLSAHGTPTSIRAFVDAGAGYGTHEFTTINSYLLPRSGDSFMFPNDPFRSGHSSDQAAHNLLLLEISSASAGDRFCFIEPTTFNLAFWQGYADSTHPAVFTFRPGRIQQNDCNLSQPPARVNEPFATSLDRSWMRLGPRTNAPGGAYRAVTVHLNDAGATGMRARSLRILTTNGKLVGSGYSNSSGRFQTPIPGYVSSIVVVDDTDHGLRLASQ